LATHRAATRAACRSSPAEALFAQAATRRQPLLMPRLGRFMARLATAGLWARCRSVAESVDNGCQPVQASCMSRHTMSLALPESMREYIDQRVAAGHYGNTSEYIRELIRRDQEEQAKQRLRNLVEQGLASGPGRRRSKADEKELLAIARGEID
jgi:antitoxin ParD1/3/4